MFAQVETNANATEKKSVWVCPNSSGPYPSLTGVDKFAAAPQSYKNLGSQPMGSYGANGYLVKDDYYFSTGEAPAKLAEISLPANIVFVAETGGSARDEVYGRDDKNKDWNVPEVAGRARHSGGGNFVLADGHAKWFKAPDPWHRRSWAPITWIKYSGTPCSSMQANAQAWYYPINGEAASGCDTTDTSP